MAKKKITYNEAMQEIEQVIAEIENDELDVDKLAGKIKRVASLVATCKDKLYKLEQEVDDILKGLQDA